jgi:hypothetical protein
MAPELDLAYRTLIAELRDRALDAQFDAEFDEGGAFIRVRSKGRDYWYYKSSLKSGRGDTRLYVGPVDDEQISNRIAAFRRLKSDFQSRRRIVSTLVREARLFRPDRKIGDIVESLSKAGLFRLQACLVGTVAFQTYGTVLGYRLANTAMQTGDIDIAQFHSVSVAVEDSIAPIIDVLKAVDATFEPVPRLGDRAAASAFKSADGVRVEFLTPNRGSDDHMGKPASMPALGGAAAEPLRFLDFLIRDPVRTVMLHKGGIPVLVPDPPRFAVHKLVVAARRSGGNQKDLKDLRQVEQLTTALTTIGRSPDVKEAFAEAQARGQAWRTALASSLERMASLGMRATPAVLAGE